MDHKTGETLEGTRNSDSRADFDEDSFGSMDVNLEFSGFVNRRIKESKETLQRISIDPNNWL